MLRKEVRLSCFSADVVLLAFLSAQASPSKKALELAFDLPALLGRIHAPSRYTTIHSLEINATRSHRRQQRLDSISTQSRGTQDSSVALPVSTTTARW